MAKKDGTAAKGQGNRMNDRQRRLFIDVVDSGSFSKAAQEGFVTPQSVSQQIRRLEEEVGVDLLERGPKGVAPTEAGRVFYNGCLDIEHSIEALVAMCREIGADARSTIRLGMGRDYSLGLFNAFLPEFLQQHPNVDIEYADAHHDDLIESLRNDVFDIAESIDLPEEEGVSFVRLFRIGRSCLVSAKNPLARLSTVSPSDLRGQKVFVFSLEWAADLQAYLQKTCPDIQLLEAPPASKLSPQKLCDGGDAVYLVPNNLTNRFEPLIPLPLDIELANDYGLVFLTSEEERLADFIAVARQVFGDQRAGA